MLLSRRDGSLPANASGFDTHCDSISSRFGCSGKKVATALYFVVFVMVTGLVLLSLFVGVVTAGMEMANDRFEEEAKAR